MNATIATIIACTQDMYREGVALLRTFRDLIPGQVTDKRIKTFRMFTRLCNSGKSPDWARMDNLLSEFMGLFKTVDGSLTKDGVRDAEAILKFYLTMKEGITLEDVGSSAEELIKHCRIIESSDNPAAVRLPKSDGEAFNRMDAQAFADHVLNPNHVAEALMNG